MGVSALPQASCVTLEKSVKLSRPKASNGLYTDLIPALNISHGCCTAYEILKVLLVYNRKAPPSTSICYRGRHRGFRSWLLESVLLPPPTRRVGERKASLRGASLENWLTDAARSSSAGVKLLAARFSPQSDIQTPRGDDRLRRMASAGAGSWPTFLLKAGASQAWPEPSRPGPQIQDPGPRPRLQPPQSPPLPPST